MNAKLNFGLKSAEVEAVRYPELLSKGYLDIFGAKSLLDPAGPMLVLGKKGSGKTSCLEHLKLVYHGTKYHDAIYNIYDQDISSVPYAYISNELKDVEVESRFVIPWRWALIILVYRVLYEDNFAAPLNNDDFLRGVKYLERAKLLGTQIDESFLGRLFNPKSVRAGYAGIEGSVELGDASHGYLADTEPLLNILKKYRSNSMNILVIDGIDKILSGSRTRGHFYYAMINQAIELNKLFQQRNVPVKIIILCRTEIFERLPGADDNKIIGDLSIELNWDYDYRYPYESSLIKLINIKAGTSTGGAIVDVPRQIFACKNEASAGKVMKQYMDYTRFTARDICKLMNEITSKMKSVPPRESAIYSGTRAYSTYFIREIKDELDGYIGKERTEEILGYISSFGEKEFQFSVFKHYCEENGWKVSGLQKELSLLYDASLIANLVERPSGDVYYQFKYRRPYTKLSIQRNIFVHRAAWSQLGI